MRCVIAAALLGVAYLAPAAGNLLNSEPLALISPAAAQDMTAAKMDAARDLLSAMDARAMFARQFDVSLPTQMAEIQKAYPGMSTDTRTRIERIFKEETTASIDGLINDIALIYARRFSVEEMQRIAAFHRSEAGRKLRGQSDSLQKELNGVTNTWSLDVISKISRRLKRELEQSVKPSA